MLAVSQAFKDALYKPTVKTFEEISYKRRYWSQVDNAYKHEAAWTVIPASEFISSSPVTAQLDTEQLNEFKVSNVTLVMQNSRNLWRADNPAGHFAQDPTVSLYPFEPYLTKFRVRVGVRLASGIIEYATTFVGYATGFTSASDDKIQIEVQGLEFGLQNFNAEDVSTLVTGEVVGTGNGSTKDFTTTHFGVGIIKEVSVGGISQGDAGDGVWSVSQLNDATLAAKITFETAPASGSVRVTYRYWHQNREINDLVADLLTAAGILESNQNIDPVIFQGAVKKTWVQDSRADWLAGTFDGTEANSTLGSVEVDFINAAKTELLDDFTDGDFTNNPTWQKKPTGGGTWDASAGYLRGGPAPYYPLSWYLVNQQNRTPIGAWKFDFKWAGVGIIDFCFSFMGEVFEAAVTYPGYMRRGYGIKITNTTISLIKDGIHMSEPTASTVLASVAFSPTTATYTLQVLRNKNGRFLVYLNSSLIIDFTDATYSYGNELAFNASARQGINVLTVDNVFCPPLSTVGTFISQAFDASASISAYERLLLTYDENDGTLSFSTRTSDDGGTWDAWVATSANGQINSDAKRYIQVKADFTCPTASYATGPKLHAFTAEYTTQSTGVALANFTGKTIYDAVQELGRLANYEWGFTSDEEFFFRSKSTSTTPMAAFTRETNTSSVSGLVNGYDKVYSEVRASYGDFKKTVKTTADYPESPLARFGTKILDWAGSDIVISGNIASGIAETFFAYFSKARKRFNVKCKYSPHVQLSDVVQVSFDQNAPRPRHFAGDESRYAGEADLMAWGASGQLVGDMVCKVIGLRHDRQNGVSDFDCEEIV